MRPVVSHLSSLAAAVGFLAGTVTLAGCGLVSSHPDKQAAIYNALDNNDLRSVTLAQDRIKGVITLNGVVGYPAGKSKAEALATQAAPGYTVVNNIRVDADGLQAMVKQANLNAVQDRSIERQFESALQAHPNLYQAGIQAQAVNHRLVLHGVLSTDKQWRQVDELARKTPDVRQVDNYIEVRSAKHARANS